MPPPAGESIAAACANVTKALAAMPKEVCANATATVLKAGSTVCQSIKLKPAARG